jgi:hypothetical protein
MSVPVRIVGFLLLIVVVFLAAWAIGSRVGPVARTHGGPGSGGMHMGAVARAARP